LDFEKAYDRISWSFMRDVFEKQGFHAYFIRGVMFLYKNVTSSVIVNGKVGGEFDLSLSVRQVCPLAPFLFMVVLDSLGYMLKDRRYGVKGFSLPDGSKVTDASYVEDTALYIEGTIENLNKAYEVLRVFCLGSGSKLNWDKTYAIWASKNKQDFSWEADLGVKWVSEGTRVRYLRPLIGFHLPSNTNTTPLIDSINKKLKSWASKMITTARRVIIINQVLLATCWFTATCCGIFAKNCTIIRGLVTKYLWSGREEGRCASRVRWSSCILSQQQGGIQLWDPFLQTQAVLAKLVVRGLSLGMEPWKK